MSTIKERVERSLAALDAGRPLAALVEEIIREYPDPYLLAYREAARLLVKHTGKAMDPRFVWWHQFDRGAAARLPSMAGSIPGHRPSRCGWSSW